MRVLTRLLALPLLVGAVLGLAATGASAAGVAGAGAALAAPTYQPTSPEAKYVPVSPCRIVDTRTGTGTNGTPYGSEVTRQYYVGGTFGFAPQGGKSGGCGVPVGAVAIAAVITAVDPQAGGFVRAWPADESEPGATVLNYSTHSNGSGLTLTIDPDSAQSLKVKNYGGPTDLVIDVNGYYVKPMAAMVSGSGALYSGSSRAISSTKVGTGVYDIEFDRNVRYCTAVASPYVTSLYASTSTFAPTSVNAVRVYVWNAAGAATDQYVYLTVDC
ncbi:hypothetical protein GIS00_18480 [Nakamurella sp. YIM 132087]|uniref:Uncharacterized protein n=1 Tax=Nakamurella alba TaxID=2665158 RepID=A0A7K1FP46_9ACTN|nr:hypothetical protein [Nakamurella alba]MTD15925.1 hypothetical protein [Nakamurella alba]